MSEIKNRYEFVYLFDVENGNPNGDPDAGNMPRIDPETNHGIVTDVCLKRKIRDYVYIAKEDNPPNKIYVKQMSILEDFRREAYEALGIAEKDIPKKGAIKGDVVEAGKKWLCEKYFDIRAFGAVMAQEASTGVIRGPIQINFSKSIEPIVPLEISITCTAVQSRKRATEDNVEHEFGNKHIVPYGLYRAEGYISANLAQKTGFSEDDLALLWESLINMFDHDHSAARGKMNARKLIVFKHDSEIGNAPAHKLFELVKVEPNHEGRPARAFEDYSITVNKNAPNGVEVIEKL